MRFTPVSLALLALAHAVAPGARAAPVVVPDRMDSLTVRQDPSSLVTGLLASIVSTVQGLLGGAPPAQAVEQTIQQVVQGLESALANPTGLIPRALPSSSYSTLSTPTPSTTQNATSSMTKAGLPVATLGNAPAALGTPQASAPRPPAIRMRRQLPPSSVPHPAPSSVCSLSPARMRRQSPPSSGPVSNPAPSLVCPSATSESLKAGATSTPTPSASRGQV